MQNNHLNYTNRSPLRVEVTIAENNRLEALKMLSRSILQHLDNLQNESKVAAREQIDLAEEVDRYEADLIRCALLRTGGRQRRAARLLNVKASTLNAKIKRLGISNDDLNNFEAVVE